MVIKRFKLTASKNSQGLLSVQFQSIQILNTHPDIHILIEIWWIGFSAIKREKNISNRINECLSIFTNIFRNICKHCAIALSNQIPFLEIYSSFLILFSFWLQLQIINVDGGSIGGGHSSGGHGSHGAPDQIIKVIHVSGGGGGHGHGGHGGGHSSAPVKVVKVGIDEITLFCNKLKVVQLRWRHDAKETNDSPISRCWEKSFKRAKLHITNGNFNIFWHFQIFIWKTQQK